MRHIIKYVAPLFAALSLFSPVRKIADKIFWDYIFRVVGPLTPFLTENWLPILLSGAVIYLWSRDGYGADLLARVRAKLNPYLVVAAVTGVLCIAALFGAWQIYRQGPIVWVLDSPGSPLEFVRAPNSALVFSGFRVSGESESNLPISFRLHSVADD